ncbi:GUP1 [Symbiodinium microadriaticum]|nr:GUP1 [Symbiodinium microadriaticum]
MEEFLSVLFSLLNGLPYLYYVAGGMHSEHWLGSVLKVSAAFHCITWMLSALFHARPTVFFEHLDYSGVILTCLVEFFTVLLRVADCRDGRACNMALSGGALLFGAYSVGMPILNFPWRVQQLISQGVLGVTAALWIWYGVRERHNPLTQHIAMPWAFLLVFCVLELVDLPPFDMPGPLYGWVDSHCLWHLVTIPINAWIVYGWILEGDAARNGKKGSERQCLHWRNAEQRAIIWTGIFLIVFSVAVVPTWLQSGQLCSQHTRCRRELRPSWLGSMDLSDPQWRAFREKLPLLVAVAVSTTLLRRACPRLKPVAAFLYCLVLHGLGGAAIFLGSFLLVFYLRRFRTAAMGAGWSLALCLLYVKDVRWAEISTPGLAGLHDWRLVAKYAALRLISIAAEAKPQHTLWQVFDFFFHPALWLAGPIMSLDDFVTSSPPSFKLCVLYGLRIIGLLLLQEFVLTLVPFFAILQTRMLDPFRTRSFASLLYAAINGLWLKFAVMWRFFRLWALFDGIQAPENIPRCINTHRTLAGFWQGWHCSFNRWVVHYIYIPLGGRKNRFFSVWVVFLFSACWHDVSAENWPALFLWGLLNVFHLSLEWAVQTLWKSAWCSPLRSRSWIRNCFECAAGMFTSAAISVTTFIGVLGGPTFLQSFAEVVTRSTNWFLDAAGVLLVLGCIIQVTMAMEDAVAAGGKQS